MSRHSLVEVVEHATASDPLTDKIDAVCVYSLTVDDDCATIESVVLDGVRLVRRGFGGEKLGELIVKRELLLPLYHVLGDVLIARDRVERLPEPEPTPDEIEQPDASTGQTFTVGDPHVTDADES